MKLTVKIVGETLGDIQEAFRYLLYDELSGHVESNMSGKFDGALFNYSFSDGDNVFSDDPEAKVVDPN